MPAHHFLSKVPAQKYPNYVSPLPRFHPVPTGPVFAPQGEPPRLLEHVEAQAGPLKPPPEAVGNY